MKYVLSCLLLFFLISSAQSEVNIPSTCRVKNKPDGYCVYASMEIIGRHYKNERLYGLVDWYSQWPSRGANTKEVKECLDPLGVKYKIYENASLDWLKYQVDNEIPIIIGLKWTIGYHAIIITDIKDGWVRYIDSNDIRTEHWVNLEWFLWAWEPRWCIKIIPQ